jgi:hypothetical protein
MNSEAIDRYELVARNNPVHGFPDTGSPLSVGNGEFAFTADITGLQTFRGDYEYFPLCTMSQWAWHSFPVDLDYSKLHLKQFDTYGRNVGYAVDAAGQELHFRNLRENAHRLNLAAIGLLIERDGKRAVLADLTSARQKLDMWKGLLQSDFLIYGETVHVETCADPELDAVSAGMTSGLAGDGGLAVEICFPYGSPQKNASDWLKEEAHESRIIFKASNRVIIKRTLDRDIYYTDIVFNSGADLKRTGLHRFLLTSETGQKEIAFTCRFSSEMPVAAPYGFDGVKQRAAAYWERFWISGGSVQLVKSKDPRARELERRIVLSQYLTAIQCCGTVPPAETGLSCNSWYGKFHLEMHYWHAAHFPLWSRSQLLERSMGWYAGILPVAREIAARQGYAGARWPKMCDISGSNTPSFIAVLLVWQQPHPIMLAELCYRADPNMETLKKYRPVVLESAEFMASFAHYDKEGDRYVIGPPLIPAQETHDPVTCINPAYEVEYFKWGLLAANEWLVRLGEPEVEFFAEVAGKLSALPVKDGVYLAHENCPETFTKAPFYHDHPSMLAALGILTGLSVDRETMKNTVEKVLQCWDFDSMWGWDFAMMAMCCARLGLSSLAVDLLLMDKPKNTFAANGHNSQADRDDLPLYLPGNGGLLLAVAMMAAGWDNDWGIPAPGFPQDGSWTVEAEGIRKYI